MTLLLDEQSAVRYTLSAHNCTTHYRTAVAVYSLSLSEGSSYAIPVGRNLSESSVSILQKTLSENRNISNHHPLHFPRSRFPFKYLEHVKKGDIAEPNLRVTADNLANSCTTYCSEGKLCNTTQFLTTANIFFMGFNSGCGKETMNGMAMFCQQIIRFISF